MSIATAVGECVFVVGKIHGLVKAESLAALTASKDVSLLFLAFDPFYHSTTTHSVDSHSL